MEFFERAHISKKESLKKDSKSEETVKKQLKQMLEGFRQSDNKLIKKSENVYLDPQRLLDDSSSVSGFSDLNLTNSSNEGDMSRGNGNESEDDEPSTDLNVSKDDEVSNHDDIVNSTVSSLDSISECKDVLESLSEDMSHLSSITSDVEEIDNLSLVGSIGSTTDVDSESSFSFDADGALATKIHKKLNLKNKTTKKSTAKKLNKKEMKMPPKIIVEEFKQQYEENDDDEIKEDDKMETDSDVNEESNSSLINSNVSSPYISVSATELPNHSFSDLLGDYKHSTVKNMPSDIQTINSTDDTMFSADVSDMNVVTDIHVQSSNDEAEDEFDLSEHYDDVTYESATNNTASEEAFDQSSVELSEEFVNPMKVYYARNSCIFVLQHPAELYIHGKVNVRALGGTVEIFGYTLKDEDSKVFAPNYNYAQCLKTVDSDNAYYGLFSKLTSVGISVHEAEEIVTSIGPSDGVVCLTPLKCKQMDFVENNFYVTDLFSKASRNMDACMRQPSEVLGCSLYLSRPMKAFGEKSSWRQAVKYSLRPQSRGIVCGGKGVGKSTFLRYTVNRLLSQGPVLVIDLDPGQSEFSVAGGVSATIVSEPLLGPNFTHLRKPDKMLYLGMINTMDNPKRYAAAVSSLLAHCHQTEAYQRMPWIVNTMGMCNAMGLNFITHIILQTKPTYLLQIDSKTAKKRFAHHLNPGVIMNLSNKYQYSSLFEKGVIEPEILDYSFFVCDAMESTGTKDFSLAPRDERYLNYLAYFGELLRTREETTLLSIRPFEVSLREIHIGLNVRVPAAAAPKVINGKVVALCKLQSDDVTVFTLRDSALVCYGHGLVRGIDLEKEKVYIITPCQELAAVTTLVYADWSPELRQQAAGRQLAAPYRAPASRLQRQLMHSPRRRFNPLQLIKMSRNS